VKGNRCGKAGETSPDNNNFIVIAYTFAHRFHRVFLSPLSVEVALVTVFLSIEKTMTWFSTLFGVWKTTSFSPAAWI
jgi:hypothetical protein